MVSEEAKVDETEVTMDNGDGDQSPRGEQTPSGTDSKRGSLERRGSQSPESLASRTKKAWLGNCRKIFDEFDTDGSGNIDIGEFGDLLKRSGLHYSEQDIVRICKEFDASGDGEIDFDEFTTFLQAQGMGPGKGGGGVQLTDALRTINTTVKANQLDMISDKEKALIQQSIAPVCPKEHPLEKVTLGELALEKFYYGSGGFICDKCDLHSDNLATKAAYLCATCQHVLCSMCANINRQAKIETEVRKRESKKMDGLSSMRKSKGTNDQKLVRRGGSIRFTGGGVRASIPSLPQGELPAQPVLA